MDIIFPVISVCSNCGRVLKEFNSFFLCSGCNSQIKRYQNNCSSGEEFLKEKLIPVEELKFKPDRVISPCLYEGIVRDMVHKLKYRDNRNISITMAAMITEVLRENRIEPEIIVAVPIHMKRLKKRGYNQSELIATELSGMMSVPHIKVLERNKDTPSQVLFNGSMRWYNVKDAFKCVADLEEKSVLLIDDVITTGATVCFCTEALKAAGASYVVVASFARAE